MKNSIDISRKSRFVIGKFNSHEKGNSVDVCLKKHDSMQVILLHMTQKILLMYSINTSKVPWIIKAAVVVDRTVEALVPGL